MTDDLDNPYLRFDLDPGASPEELTAALRDRMEDARTEAERDALRAAWETLTMHPERRLRAALQVPPSPLDAPLEPPAPPPLPRVDAPRALADLLPRPRPSEPYGASGVTDPVPLDDDPILD